MAANGLPTTGTVSALVREATSNMHRSAVFAIHSDAAHAISNGESPSSLEEGAANTALIWFPPAPGLTSSFYPGQKQTTTRTNPLLVQEGGNR